MLHICKNRKGILPKVHWVNNSQQGAYEVCTCGKLIQPAPLPSMIKYLPALFSFIQVIVIIYLCFLFITPARVEPIVSYINGPAIIESEDEYSYYLHKSSFIRYGQTHDVELQQVEDFQAALINFLTTSSNIVEEYNGDTEKLWEFVQQNNSSQINTITTQLDASATESPVALEELRGWSNIIVGYNKEKIKEIPTIYYADIQGEVERLHLKKLRFDPSNKNTVLFDYSIDGRAIHHNKKGKLFLNDKAWSLPLLVRHPMENVASNIV